MIVKIERKKKGPKKKKEFSKALLIQESALIWIMSLIFLFLAFYCIYKGFLGSLPWLTAMIGFPWTAYGVSQVFYYKKSLAENTKNGVKYQAVLAELDKAAAKYKQNQPTTIPYDNVRYANEAPTYNDNPDDYQI